MVMKDIDMNDGIVVFVLLVVLCVGGYWMCRVLK